MVGSGMGGNGPDRGGASKAIEFRAAIFHATNTPLFAAPNAVLGSAGFGTITTAGDPRVVQLAAKLLF